MLCCIPGLVQFDKKASSVCSPSRCEKWFYGYCKQWLAVTVLSRLVSKCVLCFAAKMKQIPNTYMLICFLLYLKQPLRLMNNVESSAAQEAGIRSVSQCVWLSLTVCVSSFVREYGRKEKKEWRPAVKLSGTDLLFDWWVCSKSALIMKSKADQIMT